MFVILTRYDKLTITSWDCTSNHCNFDIVYVILMNCYYYITHVLLFIKILAKLTKINMLY